MFAFALEPGPGALIDVQLNLGSILVMLELSLFVWLVWYGNRPTVLARYRERDPVQGAETIAHDGSPPSAPGDHAPWVAAERIPEKKQAR